MQSLRHHGAVLLCILAMASPVWGQTNATAGLPVYVSDQFQATARKVVQQVAADAIARSCPVGQPLCKPMVQQLSSVVSAAAMKDEVKLRDSLNNFFVLSSTTGLLQVVMGDLLSIPQQGNLAEALAPVGRCLATVLHKGNVREQCELDEKQLAALENAITEQLCANDKSSCSDATGLTSALRARPIRPGDITRALAKIAASDRISRPDLNIYLQSLGEFFDQGLDDGLFEATYAFLMKDRPSFAERALINQDWLAFSLWNPSQDAHWTEVIAACQLSLEPFQAWQAARTDTLKKAREAVLTGRPLELAPLQRLLTAYPVEGCKSADDRQKAGIRQLRNFALNIHAPLQVGNTFRQFGVPGLLSAALIDYVRTSNQEKLDAALQRTLLFGAAQVVAYQQMTRQLVAERSGGGSSRTVLVTPADLLDTCEFRKLQGLLGLSQVVASTANPSCYELKTSKPGTWATPSTLTDLGPLKENDALPVALRDVADTLVFRSRETHKPETKLLGTILTDSAQMSDQDWANFKSALLEWTNSRGDIVAHARLREQARQLADKVKPDPTAPSITEPQFAHLLLMTDAERARLERLQAPDAATELALLPKWLRDEVDRLKDPRLKDVEKKLRPLEPPHLIRQSTIDLDRTRRTLDIYRNIQGILENAVPEIQGLQAASGINVELLVDATVSGMNGNVTAARRSLLRASSDFLVKQVDDLTVTLVGVTEEGCKKQQQWSSVFTRQGGACAAQLLIRSAYHPISDYLWETGLSADMAPQLAERTYRGLLASPLLETTPLLLNVGLGTNFVFGKRPFDSGNRFGEGGFAALTLLDKFGVAFLRHTSEDWVFETGPFVGGFLDALVRTTAGTQGEKYWLFGYTVGFSRMFGYGLGLELHVAGATPFTFHSDPRFTLGAALVVPLNTVFE